jgi:hypothetical protein
LLSEADSLPVNFETELKPVRTAVSATDAWLSLHRDSLLRLGVLSPSPSASDTLSVSSETDEKKEKGSEAPSVSLSVSTEDLEKLIQSAAELPTAFPALRFVSLSFSLSPLVSD